MEKSLSKFVSAVAVVVVGFIAACLVIRWGYDNDIPGLTYAASALDQ